MIRTLVIPDSHHPYHDKRKWKLLLKVGAAFKFVRMITLGDFGEFFIVMTHRKTPGKSKGLEWEIAGINKALDELDALKIKDKIFISGNHEDRLERFLIDKAPELFDTVKLTELLKLDKRGWKHVPYKHFIRVGKFNYTHDLENAGRTSVFKNLDQFQDNICGGHTHRFQYIVEGNVRGKKFVSHTPGWLGDVRQVDYKHRAKADKEWADGFSIHYKDEKTGHEMLVPVPIVDNKCIVEGKLFAA